MKVAEWNKDDKERRRNNTGDREQEQTKGSHQYGHQGSDMT